MIFDLNTRKTDTKEGCRHDKTDKCCTVTAYNHNNRNVCCFDSEFSSDADQDRHQTEEECLKDNLADLIAILIDYCTGLLISMFVSSSFIYLVTLFISLWVYHSLGTLQERVGFS